MNWLGSYPLTSVVGVRGDGNSTRDNYCSIFSNLENHLRFWILEKEVLLYSRVSPYKSGELLSCTLPRNVFKNATRGQIFNPVWFLEYIFFARNFLKLKYYYNHIIWYYNNLIKTLFKTACLASGRNGFGSLIYWSGEAISGEDRVGGPDKSRSAGQPFCAAT